MIVSKRGHGTRRRSMHLVAGRTRCCPRQGCLRLIKHLLHRLLLWNWMMTTSPEALQQEVNERRQDEKKQQQKGLPNPQGFHSGLAYCFRVATRWSSVSAIESRIAVSACTFFIL